MIQCNSLICMESSLVRRPSFSPVLISCSMQKQGGSPGQLYHLNEVSVEQGKQRRGRSSPPKKQVFEALSSCFCLKYWSFEHSGSNKDPPPIHIIHVINGPGLPPPFLHTASDQKLDGRNAWEVAIVYHC